MLLRHSHLRLSRSLVESRNRGLLQGTSRAYFAAPTRIAYSIHTPDLQRTIMASPGMNNSSSEDPAVRITRWGLYSNAGMVVVKGVGGYMLNSQSLIADAGHSVAGKYRYIS